MDRQRRAGLLFVLPALVYFSAVFLVPLVESVIGSFYRTVPGGASRYVGTRLYEKILTDSTFWQAVGNTARLLLYKGSLRIAGRKSPVSLYRPDIATFEEDAVYDQRDAEGFIRLNALRLRIRSEAARRGS